MGKPLRLSSQSSSRGDTAAMSATHVSRERSRGALLGMAAGDSLGTTLEFRSPGTFEPITTIVGGGPFKLNAGQWTDDTSMGLCLAESLIKSGRFDATDQLSRYVRWWREGYLSSTGACVDIGIQTREALAQFERTHSPSPVSVDPEAAGNGSIMRLAAVPVAYALDIENAIKYSGASSMTTHPAPRPVDACRYLGALIAAAVCGTPKAELLDARFWRWGPLDPEIAEVAAGSFKRRQPPEIKGTGYVVRSLEAALWALYNSDSFSAGALLAVNLGDDADTTGAVYGQIAGAIYGEAGIPEDWRGKLALHDQIVALADALSSFGSMVPPTSESYWVTNRLLAGKYPGAKIKGEAIEKISALVAAGVRTFIDLTQEGELSPYVDLLPAGVNHTRVAVTDVTAPDAIQIRKALDLIEAGRKTGDVYLHCWGGCGRTGVIVACFLREQGWDADQALARVHELTRAVQSKPCPETTQQIKTVVEWTPRRAAMGEGTVAEQGDSEPPWRPDRESLAAPGLFTDETAPDGDDTTGETPLPELSEGEFPMFVVNAAQRQRWRLVLGITRKIAGRDDLIFAEQLYFGDLPTDDGGPDGGASESERLLNEPIATCALGSEDAPWLASASLDPGEFTEPIAELSLSFDPSPFPPGMLGQLAMFVMESFTRTGELPPVGVDGWRACLRETWRSRWNWLQEEAAYGDPDKPRSWQQTQPQQAALLRALVNAIHTEISQEEQWWWAPDETPTACDRWERAVARSEESFAAQTLYHQAFDHLGEIIEAVKTRRLSPLDALTATNASAGPLARYRYLCGRQLALGLVADVRAGETADPTLGTLYTARAAAWQGTRGLTYEQFGSSPVLDVVGASEASEILGVEVQRISRWRKDGRLPEPYADLAMSPVWIRADIERIRDGLDVITCTEPPEPPVLLGTAEAANLLGVGRPQITRWRQPTPTRRSPAFPDPAVTVKAGPIWTRWDLEKFAFAHEQWKTRA
jgi:ADP-ribosyl-[dinitrogen reductase] hydrolase